MVNVDHNATRRHWDSLAASYDDAKQRNAVYYRFLKSLVSQSIPASQRRRVLDVGCGTGQVLAVLAPQAGLGVDESPAMIEQARLRWADRPELAFQVADAASVATLGSFDAVVCTDVLEHAGNWPAVVDALAAACRAGGLVALTTPNPRWAPLLWLLEKLRLKMREGPHRYVDASAVAGRLRALGFSIREASTHLLLPARLAGLGPLLSRAAARVPVLRRLGVIQLVVAERSPRYSSAP